MKKIAKACIVLLTIILVLILCIFIYVVIVITQAGETSSLNLAKLNSYNAQVKIFDNTENELVTTSAHGNKTINLEELPQYVSQAFISIEDKKFYSHQGINVGRIIKACFNNLVSGYAKEGASTITQQLIKNTHLSNEKTLSRKIQEAYLATQLERKYTKEEILETYLNVIYFGNNSYGIESASQNYFGHSAKDLSLVESATLAGLIKSPKNYSPIFNADNCIKRRNLVLKNMYQDSKISLQDYNSAIEEPLNIINSTSNTDIFNKIILEQATKILNLSETDVSTMGYKIYTYIDKDLQNSLKSESSNSNKIDKAIIVIDNLTNGVVAYIGNAEQKRQVGSTIKPILCYTPAFEMGKLSPITPILDEETNFNGYCPKNANGKFMGWVSTRTALSKSLNIPAIKTLEYNGIDKSINIAKKFGLSFDNDDIHLAIALGATKYGENLQTMANAYATFSRNGTYSNLNFIKKIETGNGTIVYQNKPDFNQIITADTSYLINDILQDTITNGTAKRLSTLNIPLAAKTGTVGASDGTNTDAWCISYNPKYTVGTWLGNTGKKENNLSSSENGGTVATSLNKNVWLKLKKLNNNNIEFQKPNSIIECDLDAISLSSQRIELATENTPEIYIVKDIFSTRYAPNNTSSTFSQITTPVLEMNIIDNKLHLSWEALDYLNYTLFSEENGKNEILSKFEGKNDKVNYTISIPNKNTNFYLEVEYKNSNNKKAISNIVKYYKTEHATNEITTKNATKKIAKHWYF